MKDPDRNKLNVSEGIKSRRQERLEKSEGKIPDAKETEYNEGIERFKQARARVQQSYRLKVKKQLKLQ